MSRIWCPRAMGRIGTAPSWRVCFRTPRDVADAGGVFSAGSVYTFTGTGLEASAAPADQVGLAFQGAHPTGVLVRGSIRLRLRSPTADITNATVVLTRGTAGGASEVCVGFIAGNLRVRIGGGNYGEFVAALATEYELLIVYDGTRATNADKLKVYVNGAPQALAFTGTIPASIASDQPGWGVFRYPYGALASRQGETIRDVGWWDVVLNAEDALDLYQANTFTEVDAAKALIWLPLRSWYVDGGGIAKTQNLGTGGDATLGDGTTVASFPTFVGPHCVSNSAGTRYFRTPLIDPVEYNTPHTVGAIVDMKDAVIQSLGVNTYDSVAVRGMFFACDTAASGAVRYYLFNSAPNYLGLQWGNVTHDGLTSIIITYDGSRDVAGVNCYANGVRMAPTVVVSNTLSATIASGRVALVYAYWAGASPTTSARGKRAFPFLFPFVLTPGQVSWLHERLMREVNSWAS